jgi:protocatechuate 3,4-dioxygenase beta subunit
MKIARRRLLRRAGALGMLAALRPAWAQAAPACSPAPQCRLACGPTASAMEGPFYVSSVPSGTDINGGRARGQPMRVAGTVYAEDGVTPLAGVRVELWHCDAEGDYHPSGNGDIARYRRGEVNLRGTITTDADGRYAFTSIVPGHYGNRRRHLHWKVAAPGHRPLTTQSYWADERGTARDRADFVDRGVEPCRWVAFHDQQGTAVGAFDVVLRRAG